MREVGNLCSHSKLRAPATRVVQYFPTRGKAINRVGVGHADTGSEQGWLPLRVPKMLLSAFLLLAVSLYKIV